MSRRSGLLVAVGVTGLAAAGAALLDPASRWVGWCLMGGGVVVGELLELRPADRPAIPLSYAVVLVLARDATLTGFVATVGAGELLASVVRTQPSGLGARLALLARRAVAAAAALACYRAIRHPGADGRWVVLLALATAATAELAVDEAVRVARTRRLSLPLRHRSAELALVTSGMLMALGARGIEGRGAMGLWAPLFFSVPLLAAWYSFERLAGIRRTYAQTLRALSVVPELGGFVRPGHAERVAELAVALGADLGLDPRELEHVEAAALLHHLGHVCLDDPVVRGRPVEPTEVATATAAMLRETEYLAPAGRLLAPEPTTLGGQILRVASAFDELTEGDEARAHVAVEALASGPGYVYDPRVLAALRRLVARTPVTAA